MIKFIDLFSGTGGIRLGLQQALSTLNQKSECVFSCEINKKACETYSLNFEKQTPIDITAHNITDENNHIANFQILLAGFPCQAFSYAGKRRGFEDTRGTLFFNVAEIARHYRPKVLFLENVRGLMTHDYGRTFKTITQTLEDIGYTVKWRVINSSEMGVPQNRFRLYGIAVLGDDFSLSIPDLLGSKDTHSLNQQSYVSHKYVREILEDNPDPKFDCSKEFRASLEEYFNGDLSQVDGRRCIDSRNGNSIHSWELNLKGETSKDERDLLNLLVANRRKHYFGTHQDGKALTKEQIRTFFPHKHLDAILVSLLNKGYLRLDPGNRYNLKAGNMSFEVFKFLDHDGISITLTSSDCNRLGIFHKNRLRRLTPRECARIQGYPDSYKLHPDDKAAYRQIGNAVSVPVIRTLFYTFFTENPQILKFVSQD